MDRDPSFLSAVAAVLFFTACAYLGAALFDSPQPVPQKEEQLAPAVKSSSALIRGIAIRSEQALDASADCLGLEDGQRFCAAALASRGLCDGSAVYFENCDGYEGLSPDMLCGLSSDSLEKLMSTVPESCGGGRLVTGREWYIAAFSDTALPSDCSFCLYPDGMEGFLTAEIISSSGENGRFVVLLRLTDGSTQALKMRAVTGRLIPG